MQVTPKINADNVESSEIKSPTWCKHRTNHSGTPNLAANCSAVYCDQCTLWQVRAYLTAGTKFALAQVTPQISA